MITYHDDLVQGTEEWKTLRLRFLTGTDAYQLLKGRRPDDILARKRESNNSFKGNKATRRGHRLEPEAVRILEAIKGVKVHHTGFITNSNYPLAGYSPDGLIGEDGLVECKAFNEERHSGNRKRIDIEIQAQVQWGLFVSNRKWAYIVFYNPDLSPEDAIIIKRVERNEKAMDKFRKSLGV